MIKEDGLFVDGSGEEAAVVFYPGAKVEYTQTVKAIMQMIDGKKETKQKESDMNYQQITAQEAKKIIDEEPDICILDVRTQEEYDSAGRIQMGITRKTVGG